MFYDTNGNRLPVIDDAVAWLTCDHDIGYGACRGCRDNGETMWAAQKGEKTGYEFDSLADALDWAND